MKAFRMTAIGVEGTEFVYEADSNDDTTPEEAAIYFYYLHGKDVAEGRQTELLGPQRVVEEI